MGAGEGTLRVRRSRKRARGAKLRRHGDNLVVLESVPGPTKLRATCAIEETDLHADARRMPPVLMPRGRRNAGEKLNSLVAVHAVPCEWACGHFAQTRRRRRRIEKLGYPPPGARYRRGEVATRRLAPLADAGTGATRRLASRADSATLPGAATHRPRRLATPARRSDSSATPTRDPARRSDSSAAPTRDPARRADSPPAPTRDPARRSDSSAAPTRDPARRSDSPPAPTRDPARRGDSSAALTRDPARRGGISLSRTRHRIRRARGRFAATDT